MLQLPLSSSSDVSDCSVGFRSPLCSPTIENFTPYSNVYGLHPSDFSSFGRSGQMLACLWTSKGIAWLQEQGYHEPFGSPACRDVLSSAQLQLLSQLGYAEDAAKDCELIDIEQLDAASSTSSSSLKSSPLVLRTPRAGGVGALLEDSDEEEEEEDGEGAAPDKAGSRTASATDASPVVRFAPSTSKGGTKTFSAVAAVVNLAIWALLRRRAGATPGRRRLLAVAALFSAWWLPKVLKLAKARLLDR